MTNNFKRIFLNISAVQTCENRDLKMLENYGLKAHSLDPVPIGGVVNVKVFKRESCSKDILCLIFSYALSQYLPIILYDYRFLLLNSCA